MKHFTKGPWLYSAPKEAPGIQLIFDSESNLIAEVRGVNTSDATNEANARLAAASPDLLEAVELAKFSIDKFGSSDPNAVRLIEKLDAALKRALT